MDEKQILVVRVWQNTKTNDVTWDIVEAPLKENPPRGTPAELPVDTNRLDRIWKCLQAYMEPEVYAKVRVWAERAFGYRYYTPSQRYPVDLRTAVCDRLRGFTEPQITELEKYLEVKE